MTDSDPLVPLGKIERILEVAAQAQPTTAVPLLAHIERILIEHQKAVERNTSYIEYRLDLLNHWREETVSDRELFLQRNVYNEMHAAIERRVEAVERVQARLQGVGLVFMAMAAVFGAIIAHLLKL